MTPGIGLIGATAVAERAMVRPGAEQPGLAVRAVAASDPARARRFAARHGLPTVHQCYDDVIADPAVDAVYISLHNSAHARWACRALEKGKHVLVEKPLCLTTEELAEIDDAASRGGAHVLETLVTAGHEWQSHVREFIRSGELGALREVHSRFAFEADDVTGYRFDPGLGGGAFYDAAAYWLQALQGTAGIEGARGTGESDFDGPNGVDVRFTARAGLAGGATATLDCALAARHTAQHEFVFDEGRIRMRNVLLPALGRFPLNIAVRPAGKPGRVIACAPVDYYREQCDRVARRLAGDLGGWGADLADAAPRITLMAAIHQDATTRRAQEEAGADTDGRTSKPRPGDGADPRGRRRPVGGGGLV